MTTKTTPETLELAKFPLIEKTKEKIEVKKKMIDLLEKRKALIKSGWDNLSEFEQNERMITLLKTDFELSKIHSNIHQTEDFIKQYSRKVASHVDEVHERFEDLMKRALKTVASGHPMLSEIMANADFDSFEHNWENKIGHYLKVKEVINQKPHLRKA